MTTVLRRLAQLCFTSQVAFASTAMFGNICCNAIAGRIDLAGFFPQYTDIHCSLLSSELAAEQPRDNIYNCSVIVFRVSYTHHWHHGLQLSYPEEEKNLP
jgi:hypothetical protein